MKQSTLIPLALFCLFCTSTIQAQVDIKVNPLGLLFNNINASVEFGVKDNFGIEVTPGFGWDKLNLFNDGDYKGQVYRLGVNGRYYLNPTEKGLNGFYIGGYTRYKGGRFTLEGDQVDMNKFSLGFILGGKVVAQNGRLIFDFGTGFGRALLFELTDAASGEQEDISDIPIANWDIPLYISIGYRFGGGS